MTSPPASKFRRIPRTDLDKASDSERDRYVRYVIHNAVRRDEPIPWLQAMFPQLLGADFAAHHQQFWAWLWAIEPDRRPHPFVGIWPRGGAKSTSAEMGCVVLGARHQRRYGIYICATQQQADDHVSSIGSLLESRRVADMFPDLAERMVGKYGSSKGWRRNRLRTASGFTIDALGLDVAARGVKLDEQRPDFMVFDDLDETDDGLDTIGRKERELTRKLLPAGAPDLAVLAIQNLIHSRGIFARLANITDRPADYLADRIVSGPIPAVQGLEIETREGRQRIMAGTATWAGQSIETCEEQIADWGVSAFRIEAQHEVELFAQGMFAHIDFAHVNPETVPELLTVEVWVDPAVTATDQSDSMGIQADGITADATIYRLRSWEKRATPLEALTKAIVWAFELGAMRVGVETDQGGDTWQSVYREALGQVLAEHPEWQRRTAPFFDERKAGAGYGPKVHRAQLMLTDYERPGRIVHVDGWFGPGTGEATHWVLERGLKRFPVAKPYDLVDAAFWSWHALRELGQGDTPDADKIIRGVAPKIGRTARFEINRKYR